MTTPAYEYAIQLGDGTMQPSYDEYAGEGVAIWTDRDAALYERDRIISCGIHLVDGVIHRDPKYTQAKLVRRPMRAWELEPAVVTP